MGIIKGTAYWASVTKPNTTFEPTWTINVGNLDDVAKAQLEADGLSGKIKNKGDDQGDFIQIKQKCESKDGNPFDPPTVIGRLKQPFTDNIGNGSEVAVKYSAADSEAFGGGRTAYLKAVQVITQKILMLSVVKMSPSMALKTYP